MKLDFPKAHDSKDYEIEKLSILKAKLGMITNWMALPLFLFFWLCDLVFFPELKWEFLFLRLAIVPLHFVIHRLCKQAKTLTQGEWLSLTMVIVYSAIINSMIFWTGDIATPYYAGLNLIAIGALTFIPWRSFFFIAANIVLFAPYFIGFLAMGNTENFTLFLVNTFFIIGTAVITMIIRLFHESLQIKEFNARALLSVELKNRESIIKNKTKEGMRLAALSSQFSPQIVEAIKKGDRLIDTQRHRSEICAIFIDAVESTDRLVRLDHRYFIEAIEEFMEISINTLLKYDLTIDKFYGDGVLAFANDPVKRPDFIERTCGAALDIRNQVSEKQAYFRRIWKKEFNLTIGIASGYASVGFYGNTTYIKQYSAIGPCLALSQRLSSIASPNEILVDQHIKDLLDKSDFKTVKKGEFCLKGFDDDIFEVYNVLNNQSHTKNSDFTVECSSCHENSVYIDESEGIYVLRCRKCGHVDADSNRNEQEKIAS